MAEYICRLNPRIASFYTICNTYPITILLAEKIKEINSEITVVFGGPQATFHNIIYRKSFTRTPNKI